MRNHRVKIIGLTGGIGSGKTVATNALRGAGYTVIDADEASRTLFAHGSDGEKELAAAFPEATTGGVLDRTALRLIISRDDAERTRLNAITHPRITSYIRELLAASTTSVVLSAPLLFESGLNDCCDLTVCITCPLADRIKRIVERDGMTEQAARDLAATQLSDEERIRRSDIAISSDSDIEQFKPNVLNIFKQLL